MHTRSLNALPVHTGDTTRVGGSDRSHVSPAHPIRDVTGAALERQLVAPHRVVQPGGASGHARTSITPSERGVESIGDILHSEEEDRRGRVMLV